MSQSVLDIDDKFFLPSPSEGSGPPKNVDIPESLQNAAHRLSFPPSYVVVGVYRLLSDKALFSPVWQKCRSGFLRSAAVGSVWVCDRNINLATNRRITLSHIVVSNLFDSAWVYQDLLDEVRTAVCALSLYLIFVPYSSAPRMLSATQTTPS